MWRNLINTSLCKKLLLFAVFALSMVIFWGVGSQVVLADQAPEIEWTMPHITLEYGSGTEGRDIKQTNDGGFILAGDIVTDEQFPKTEYGFLVKTDSKGNVRWMRTYPTTSYIYDSDRISKFSSIDLTDTGYIVAGGNYIFKINELGGVIWKKELGDMTRLFSPSYDIVPTSVQTTSNGNYIVAGNYHSYTYNTYYLYVAEYDNDGNMIWFKLSNPANHAPFVSVKQTNDGFLIVTEKNGAIYVQKTDFSGNNIWEKTFSGLEIAFGYSGIEINGGYLISGKTSNGHYSGYLLKIDFNGNIIWEKTYASYNRGFSSVIENTNGSFILLEDGPSSLTYSTSVIKIDYEGNILWSKENPFFIDVSAIEQTKDLGYILIGYNHFDFHYLYLSKLMGIDITAPVITGIENGKAYNIPLKPTFNEGIGKLDGVDYISGTEITTEGNHELVVTDPAGNVASFQFSIDITDPVITGIENGKTYYTLVKLTFNEGIGKLDGVDYISGTEITTEGNHELVVTDPAGNVASVRFCIDGTAPSVPEGLKAINGTNKDVKLTWNINTESDLEGYEIAYLKSGNTTWITVTIEAGITSTIIEELTHNMSYTFKIRAKDQLGNWSAYSSTVTAIPKDLVAPAIPTGITTQAKDKSITLTWTANSELDLGGYQLEYKLPAASTWSVVSVPATSTTYTKTSMVNGTTYQFRLKAKDTSSNWSTYTDIVSGIPVDNVAPPIPTGLKISSINDQQVTLGWTAVSTADLAGYQIEYKKSTDLDWTAVNAGKVITYTLTGLTNGETYTIRIKSKDTSNNLSEPSAEITGIPLDKTAPAVPTGLKVTSGSYLSVNLTWNAVTAVDLGSYEITYQKAGTTSWTTLEIPAGTTGTTIEGLVKGSSYSFKIRAKDKAPVPNYSAYSSLVTATAKDLIPPAVPTGLKAASQDKAIVLTWTANTETDLAGYQLEYKLSTAATWSIASSTLSAATITYTKTSLINGTSYQFRIKAKDSSTNWSTYSDIVTATPADSVDPTTPTGFKASSFNDGKIATAWTAPSVTDLAGYQIEYKKSSDLAWTTVSVGKVVTYTITGLTNGEEYRLQIKSKDTSGNLSSASAEITATPIDKTAPAVPTGLIAVSGNYLSVNLTWTGSTATDLDSYEISYAKSGTTTWTVLVIPAGTTTTSVEDLVKGASYSFKIRVKDTAGNYSAYSTVVSATAKDLTPPAAPIGFKAENKANAVTITWTSNTETDLGGYQLEYKLSTASTWSVGSSTLSAATITYTKIGLVNGKTYEFRIKAKDSSANWSGYSDTINGIPSI